MPAEDAEAAPDASMRSVTVGLVEFLVPGSYTFLRHLGSGACGTVAAFEDARGGRKVAVKKVTSAFHDLVDAKRIVREVKILRHLEHENVLRILDVCPPAHPDFEDVYLSTELMDTDLHKVIHSSQVLTGEHVQYFLYQALRGLKYIHSANVIHRDLKPSNLLVNRDCALKIGDFGLARSASTEDEQALTHYVVTRWYRAPEVMLTGEYSSAIDLWSLGCVLAELVARKHLFPGKDPMDQLHRIARVLGRPRDLTWLAAHPSALRCVQNLPPYRAQLWPAVFPDTPVEAWTPDLLTMLGGLLQVAPPRRLDVDGALAQPYLADLHDPGDEPTAQFTLEWDFDRMEMTKRSIQNAVYQEAVDFHPFLEQRDKAWFAQRRMPFPESPTSRRARCERTSRAYVSILLGVALRPGRSAARALLTSVSAEACARTRSPERGPPSPSACFVGRCMR